MRSEKQRCNFAIVQEETKNDNRVKTYADGGGGGSIPPPLTAPPPLIGTTMRCPLHLRRVLRLQIDPALGVKVPLLLLLPGLHPRENLVYDLLQGAIRHDLPNVDANAGVEWIRPQAGVA